MERYARAFFLAFTALEEISKSQLAADVVTGFMSEDEFLDHTVPILRKSDEWHGLQKRLTVIWRWTYNILT
jgi:AbiV family abortive infection protein